VCSFVFFQVSTNGGLAVDQTMLSKSLLFPKWDFTRHRIDSDIFVFRSGMGITAPQMQFRVADYAALCV